MSWRSNLPRALLFADLSSDCVPRANAEAFHACQACDADQGRGNRRPLPDRSFSVLATAPASRPRRALKHGDTFVVIDSHGDIGAIGGRNRRPLHADTRFLSQLELTLNALQPLLLGSNVRDDNTLLAVDLTNPDYLRRRPHRAAEGHRAHRAHDVPVAGHRLSAPRGAQSRRPADRPADSRCTSTAISPTCSRCADCSGRAAAR